MIDHKKLLLKARNVEDCDVLSLLLQDSIFHISLYSFHDDKKCLRFMLNRFCWELEKNKDKISSSDKGEFVGYRVHSGLYIHNVESVIVNKEFREDKSIKYFNLLAFHASEKEINMLFSGHHQICINVGEIYVHLKDLHEKYPTAVMPEHKIA